MRVSVLAAVLVLAGAGIYMGAGVGRSSPRLVRAAQSVSAAGRANPARPATTATPGNAAKAATTATPAIPAVATPPPPPRLSVTAAPHLTGGWATSAWVRGRPAAWIARRAGVTLMRFDQSLVHLTLHAGSSDGGEGGWRYGDRITPREVHLLVAAFNGGFKLTYHDVGFMSGGRVAVSLKTGLASIVTYTDGTTDIGAWHAGVPSAGRSVYSVLQNQRLLVDRGAPAANVSSCIMACWGETLGSRLAVARSGLGITAGGQLVWAAGEQLLPADLASALISAGAVRAIELDINPYWVAGYLYTHHSSGPEPAPVVPGQHGIEGELLAPDSRDFMAIVAR